MSPLTEVEFTIDLVPGITPMSRASNQMAPLKLRELKTLLQKLLEPVFIKPNVSPWSAPILFVMKKDNSMSLCIYCRMLNQVTVKNCYPLSLIDDCLISLKVSQFTQRLIFDRVTISCGYGKTHQRQHLRLDTDIMSF